MQHHTKRTQMEIHKYEPYSPNLCATIKLHKQKTPIRPIINWKNALAYQLAKQLKHVT
jgi:hypothetical protein